MKAKKKVTAEEFIRAWQASETLAEVVATLGMKMGTAVCRATYYRKKGVLLKRFKSKGGKPLNYDALAALARSLNGNQ